MNKASGGDGIPVELFQILKDDAVKVLHSICQQIWKTQQWPQDWKRSVFIPIPKKGNATECSNYYTIALISHTSKAMLKILQARLQQYVNHELPDVQAGFRKGRGIRNQIANICWIMEKAREFQKNTHFCFIDCANAFDFVKVKSLSRVWLFVIPWTVAHQASPSVEFSGQEYWSGVHLHMVASICQCCSPSSSCPVLPQPVSPCPFCISASLFLSLQID